MPTVASRGKVPEMAAYLAGEFREVGFKEEDINIIPMGETVGMIVRYKRDGTAAKKPILLLGHMERYDPRIFQSLRDTIGRRTW